MLIGDWKMRVGKYLFFISGLHSKFRPGQRTKKISMHESGTILRFLTVGAVNTLFGIGVYWLMLNTGFNYQWATLFSLVLGIIFSFNTNRLLVFKAEGGFVRYVFAWLLIYVVNIALMSVIRDYTGDYFAGIALIPVNVVLSFVLMKRFVFRLVKGYGV